MTLLLRLLLIAGFSAIGARRRPIRSCLMRLILQKKG
jgi:hypothetical protein